MKDTSIHYYGQSHNENKQIALHILVVSWRVPLADRRLAAWYKMELKRHQFWLAFPSFPCVAQIRVEAEGIWLG